MDYRQVLSYMTGGMGQLELPDGGRRGYDLVDFLLSSVKKDVPLLVAAPNIFVYSLLLPSGTLSGEYSYMLDHWDDAHDNGAGVLGQDYQGWSGGSLPAGFLGGITCHARPIVRISEPDNGGSGNGLCVDLDRDFSDRHCLYKVSPRGVYCRLGRRGDVEDVVHVLTRSGMSLLTVARDLLCQHMDETGCELVRLIDVSVSPALVPQYNDAAGDVIIELVANGLCLRVTREEGGTLWCRGLHVVRGGNSGSMAQSRLLEAEYIGEED